MRARRVRTRRSDERRYSRETRGSALGPPALDPAAEPEGAARLQRRAGTADRPSPPWCPRIDEAIGDGEKRSRIGIVPELLEEEAARHALDERPLPRAF